LFEISQYVLRHRTRSGRRLLLGLLVALREIPEDVCSDGDNDDPEENGRPPVLAELAAAAFLYWYYVMDTEALGAARAISLGNIEHFFATRAAVPHAGMLGSTGRSVNLALEITVGYRRRSSPRGTRTPGTEPSAFAIRADDS